MHASADACMPVALPVPTSSSATGYFHSAATECATEAESPWKFDKPAVRIVLQVTQIILRLTLQVEVPA
jgi:hypothetical protein